MGAPFLRRVASEFDGVDASRRAGPALSWFPKVAEGFEV
jgi:hypothetical protein